MNTPAHVVLNLLCLGRSDRAAVLTPTIVGAVLPDLPMFFFYIVQKIRQIPEEVIWGQSYFQNHWQDFFDIFNSIPFMVVGLGICTWGGSRWGQLLFLSMILHCLGDLPLHHDDGHRHFFPFSDWRFASPVSYWDPKHHGQIVTVIEMLMVGIASLFLWRVYPSWQSKLTLGITDGIYLLYMIPFIHYFFRWTVF
jgi:hypothetical protein